jgi:hypothetical protein
VSTASTRDVTGTGTGRTVDARVKIVVATLVPTRLFTQTPTHRRVERRRHRSVRRYRRRSRARGFSHRLRFLPSFRVVVVVVVVVATRAVDAIPTLEWL